MIRVTAGEPGYGMENSLGCLFEDARLEVYGDDK